MFKFILSIVILLSGMGFCQGQETSDYVQRQIDSINRVQPATHKNVIPVGCAYVIKVRNQQDFDGVNSAISKAIGEGKKNILVKIGRGIYHFRQEHIRRKNEQADISISFIGKNAVITSDVNYNITNGRGSGWQEMQYADSIIQVVDEKKKLCMIPYANAMSANERKNVAKVQITQWFRAKTYNVESIDQEGIYFIAPELAWDNNYGHKGYNVNYDYLYLGKTPRFRLYDTSQEPYCTAARFLTLENCSYRSLSIKGIVFRGNNSNNNLLYFKDVNARQIIISDCKFDYIRGNGVAYFNGTSNVTFSGNVVSNTGGDDLFFSNHCSKVRVTNNIFENCGQSISNSFCVTCWECCYYIANNTFRDFGYGAIGVGVWHGFGKKNYSGGIIEHNEIYFTPTYFAEAWKHMLMDSGTIYTWTQNDNVIIRYNYIHDYTGAGDNRGIFCDDGANNLKIYGNVVLNTPNCYSIDSRMAKDKGDGFMNNANNFMANNVVDNRVRFQGHSDVQRHVMKGANMIVREADYQPLNNKYDNLELMEEDIIINYNDKTIKKHIKNCLHK